MSSQPTNISSLALGYHLFRTETRYSPRTFLAETALLFVILLISMPTNLFPGYTDSLSEGPMAWLIIGPALFGGRSMTAIKEGRSYLLRPLPISAEAVVFKRFIHFMFTLLPYLVAAPFWMLYLDKWGYSFTILTTLNMVLLIISVVALSILLEPRTYAPRYMKFSWSAFIPTFLFYLPLLSFGLFMFMRVGNWGILAGYWMTLGLLAFLGVSIPLGYRLSKRWAFA